MVVLRWLMHALSMLLNPICVPFYALIAAVNQPLIPHKKPLQWGTPLILWSILFAVIPLLLVLIMKTKGYITSWSAEKRRERFRLYPLTILIYLIGYASLHLQNPRPYLLIQFSVIPISLSAALFVANFFYKVSAHTAAIMACITCTAILHHHYPAPELAMTLLVLCPITLMVMFARWQLGAHSVMEIVLGGCIGTGIAIGFMTYFLST